MSVMAVEMQLDQSRFYEKRKNSRRVSQIFSSNSENEVRTVRPTPSISSNFKERDKAGEMILRSSCAKKLAHHI